MKRDMQTLSDIRIGVDSGGTFTDVVLLLDGRPLVTHKLASTSDDPGNAVLAGIESVLKKYVAQHADHPAGVSRYEVVHGSTVATNAILEGKGARVLLITTAGFEDLLWLARQNRPDLYALEPHREPPPIHREDVLGAEERMAYDGSVLKPLTDEEIARLIATVVSKQPDAVLVSLLHSYANGAHEERIGRVLREAMPEVPVTISSELLPEFREYERMGTCLINAAVGPVMQRYLGNLDAAVGENRLRIMVSHGGVLSASVAAETPVMTILSGPAGGVLGASVTAAAEGIEKIVTFDMGGTSTDVALCDGGIVMTRESEVAGLPLRLPMVDIHTVGAGGGSVAWLDAGGALRVGPRSTGAEPGPACYGKQSLDALTPAVTDAHLVLGHLADGQPLGDDLLINADLARAAIEPIAMSLDLTIEETALGILRVAEATMARAIQRVSVQRGYDPRRFTLLSFGGAGGLHACRLAEALGMMRVMIPTSPGLLSALGMLTAPVKHELSRSVMLRFARDELNNWQTQPRLSAILDKLIDHARSSLVADGIDVEEATLDVQLNLRYAGQSFELTVAADDPLASFESEHERLYGYTAPDRDIELVTLRLVATGARPELTLPRIERRAEHASCPAQDRRVYIGSDAEWVDYAAVSREALRAGDPLIGPQIITEYSATLVIPRGWSGVVSEHGQLMLQRDQTEEVDREE